ncbi:angiopoietin-related protein 7 [Penaeus vannamei]|uniref:Putative angiopoietin-related protein 7 isoform X2 n=1 Tax=Penaeus vannamei TaxID=6689 RepID=A0A3R7M4T5_PENVA|nr:angiopoietin-related protein 7-like [Penaeus vannamei]XP_027219076.1 angiopoietin-related protein 7-like [Penaeus vannamei]ROT71952.1 putative angiopoietin-related protein 7 isoform X2 [Penaeus vannamei]
MYLLVFLVSTLSASEVIGAKRRCEEVTVLQNEMQTLKEENQLLHGEVTTLRTAVENLGQSLEGLSKVVARSLPEDCSQAKARGAWSKVTLVAPPGMEPREVACDQQTDGGGWTLVLARHPPSAPRHHARHEQQIHRIGFNTSWEDYKKGFGDVRGEFWLGNEVLHALTRDVPHQVHVHLTDWDGNTAYSTWDYFRVSSETDKYRLSVKEYRPDSTAGDGFHHHNSHAFSTYDFDNDVYPDHCARLFGGGWWYFKCYESHLTGEALRQGQEDHHGLVWITWQSFRSLKAATMMIRPRVRPCKLGQVCVKPLEGR